MHVCVMTSVSPFLSATPPHSHTCHQEAGITSSCAPRISQIEVDTHTPVPEKRAQSSPGRQRALLPKKAPPLLPLGGGAKAQQPAEASTAAAQSNGPPPLPSGKKPSAEGSTESPNLNGPPPPLPSGKPKPSTEPTEELNVQATDGVPTAQKGPSANGSPPVPQKKMKQVADNVAVGPEDADSVIGRRKGPPPPLPAKEKPSKPAPTTQPEMQVKEAASGTEHSPPTPTKKQPVAVLTTSEAVGGPSPKLAPKPTTSAYKSRLSPSVASKQLSDDQAPSVSPTSKLKAEQPLPKPRNRVLAEENGVLPQQQQAMLAKPVPKPRTRSSSATRSEDNPRRPTSPTGKPEEHTPAATSAETAEDGKPTTPTVATPPPLPKKDKPSTPTSPSAPRSVTMAEKDNSSTPLSTTTPDSMSVAAEAIETNPSSAVKSPVIETPQPTPQAEVSKEANQDGVSEDKKVEIPQKQPPVDEEVDEAPPIVTRETPPTSQKATTSEGLGEVQASPPSLEKAEGKAQDAANASGDDDIYELPPDAIVPCSVVSMDASGTKAERIPPSPVSQLPPSDATTTSATSQPSEPKQDASQQYELFEMPSPENAAMNPTTVQRTRPKEDGGGQYEPFELEAEQKQAQGGSASVEVCESAYGLVDASSDGELKGAGNDEDAYANEGFDPGNENSTDSEDAYEAMVVPEDDMGLGLGYVKMKPAGPVNVLATPPRIARAEQGYDNSRLRSSPYSGHDVKNLALTLPRERESRSRSGHSSTSTEVSWLSWSPYGTTCDWLVSLCHYWRCKAHTVA